MLVTFISDKDFFPAYVFLLSLLLYIQNELHELCPHSIKFGHCRQRLLWPPLWGRGRGYYRDGCYNISRKIGVNNTCTTDSPPKHH